MGEESVNLKINFENESAARAFMTWLNDEGQNEYWHYMEREENFLSDPEGEVEEDAPFHLIEKKEKRAVVDFDYDFEALEIHTVCGDIIISDEDEDY